MNHEETLDHIDACIRIFKDTRDGLLRAKLIRLDTSTVVFMVDYYQDKIDAMYLAREAVIFHQKRFVKKPSVWSMLTKAVKEWHQWPKQYHRMKS